MKTNQPFLKDKLSISARLLYEEATARNIDCTIIDKHTLLMNNGNHSWYTRGSRTSFQSSIGKSIADKKDLTKLFLSNNSIPTAKFVSYSNKSQFENISQLHFPIVIKPSFGNQGKNVYVGIQNKSEAYSYYSSFHVDDEFPGIAEEMLEGKEYRILCINFKFIAAAYRQPAYIIGDGKKTIQELIDEKNSHPWRGADHYSPLSLITINSITLKILEKLNLTLKSILPLNFRIELKKTSNLSQGGEAINISNQVCKENIILFENIAKICDLNTIGIDVMCSDINKPITQQQKAGIIEINCSPGLRMHHYPIVGEPVNAAGKILDMVESNYS